MDIFSVFKLAADKLDYERLLKVGKSIVEIDDKISKLKAEKNSLLNTEKAIKQAATVTCIITSVDGRKGEFEIQTNSKTPWQHMVSDFSIWGFILDEEGNKTTIPLKILNTEIKSIELL